MSFLVVALLSYHCQDMQSAIPKFLAVFSQFLLIVCSDSMGFSFSKLLLCFRLFSIIVVFMMVNYIWILYKCFVCKCLLGWINCDNYVHNTQPITKSIPNCNVSFFVCQRRTLLGMWSRNVADEHVTIQICREVNCMYVRPMTVFWSRVYRQRHVTTCLMKLAVGERNVAITIRFCVWLCNMNVIIIEYCTNRIFLGFVSMLAYDSFKTPGKTLGVEFPAVCSSRSPADCIWPQFCTVGIKVV